RTPPPCAAVTLCPYTTLFRSSGSHTYLDEGGQTVTVHIVDDGGSTATATTTATINDAALSASGTANTFTEGNSKSVTVATFSDANPSATIATPSTTPTHLPPS